MIRFSYILAIISTILWTTLAMGAENVPPSNDDLWYNIEKFQRYTWEFANIYRHMVEMALIEAVHRMGEARQHNQRIYGTPYPTPEMRQDLHEQALRAMLACRAQFSHPNLQQWKNCGDVYGRVRNGERP